MIDHFAFPKITEVIFVWLKAFSYFGQKSYCKMFRIINQMFPRKDLYRI